MYAVVTSFLFECRRFEPGDLLEDSHAAVTYRSQFVKPVTEIPMEQLESLDASKAFREITNLSEVLSASDASGEVTATPDKVVPSPTVKTPKQPEVIREPEPDLVAPAPVKGAQEV